jgi:hypothetical protein
MPTVTGTSVVGRQVLQSGFNSAVTALFRVTPGTLPPYQYWGYLEQMFVTGGVPYAAVGFGLPVWNPDAVLILAAIANPNSRLIQMSWQRAGVGWSLSW